MQTKMCKGRIMSIEQSRQHAIVIGGSIAGLLAARVLSDHYAHVTLLERDVFQDDNEPRKGVPQGRHIHQILLRGAQVLEQLFPGLEQQMLAEGAIPLEWPQDTAWYVPNAAGVRFRSGLITYACSRPLLEWGIRRRLAALPNIRFQSGSDAIGLIPHANGRGVAGVQLRDRNQSLAEQSLLADLVVDASGRSSHASEWLEQLGYQKPSETVINARIGYATRLYQPPVQHSYDWKVLLVRGKPPADSRNGLIFPLEGGRWLALLTGAGDQAPPTDEAGFAAYARNLPSPLFAEALAEATPISGISGYRRTENRLIHYEQLSRWPEQFLVLGDAACAFNPVYGQGMTTAALSVLALDQTIRERPGAGMAHEFQRKLAQVVSIPWLMATGVDYQYPGVAGAKRGLAMRFQHAYMNHVLELMVASPLIYRAFIQVMHMVATPTLLFQPVIALAVAGRALTEAFQRNPPTRTQM
jgi:2-polyprenyl-6-methoxyphenol hydroxylase-like FAD-dependent oxidoreductase